MPSPSVTRTSLLIRIRDPQDRLAWSEFVQLYAPLVHAYGMRRGLQDADAADLVQDVMRIVVRTGSSFEYDRARGSFRGWLLTVTRNELRKAAARRGKQPAGSGDTQMVGFLAEQPEQRDEEVEWNLQYRWNLFHWAAERIKQEFRENTWSAFWQTVVEGRPIEEVAKSLGITAGAVYISRSRITARIREEVVAAEGEE